MYAILVLYRVKCLIEIWRERKAADVTSPNRHHHDSELQKNIDHELALMVNPNQQDMLSHREEWNIFILH